MLKRCRQQRGRGGRTRTSSGASQRDRLMSRTRGWRSSTTPGGGWLRVPSISSCIASKLASVGSTPRSLRSFGLSPSLRSRNVSSIASFQTVHPRFIFPIPPGISKSSSTRVRSLLYKGRLRCLTSSRTVWAMSSGAGKAGDASKSN